MYHELKNKITDLLGKDSEICNNTFLLEQLADDADVGEQYPKNKFFLRLWILDDCLNPCISIQLNKYLQMSDDEAHSDAIDFTRALSYPLELWVDNSQTTFKLAAYASNDQRDI